MKYYFGVLKLKQWVSGLDLGHLKLFIFVNILKKKIEKIFAKNFATNYEKKNNTWNMRRYVAIELTVFGKIGKVLHHRITS